MINRDKQEEEGNKKEFDDDREREDNENDSRYFGSKDPFHQEGDEMGSQEIFSRQNIHNNIYEQKVQRSGLNPIRVNSLINSDFQYQEQQLTGTGEDNQEIVNVLNKLYCPINDFSLTSNSNNSTPQKVFPMQRKKAQIKQEIEFQQIPPHFKHPHIQTNNKMFDKEEYDHYPQNQDYDHNFQNQEQEYTNQRNSREQNPPYEDEEEEQEDEDEDELGQQFEQEEDKDYINSDYNLNTNNNQFKQNYNNRFNNTNNQQINRLNNNMNEKQQSNPNNFNNNQKDQNISHKQKEKDSNNLENNLISDWRTNIVRTTNAFPDMNVPTMELSNENSAIFSQCINRQVQPTFQQKQKIQLTQNKLKLENVDKNLKEIPFFQELFQNSNNIINEHQADDMSIQNSSRSASKLSSSPKIHCSADDFVSQNVSKTFDKVNDPDQEGQKELNQSQEYSNYDYQQREGQENQDFSQQKYFKKDDRPSQNDERRKEQSDVEDKIKASKYCIASSLASKQVPQLEAHLKEKNQIIKKLKHENTQLNERINEAEEKFYFLSKKYKVLFLIIIHQ